MGRDLRIGAANALAHVVETLQSLDVKGYVLRALRAVLHGHVPQRNVVPPVVQPRGHQPLQIGRHRVHRDRSPRSHSTTRHQRHPPCEPAASPVQRFAALLPCGAHSPGDHPVQRTAHSAKCTLHPPHSALHTAHSAKCTMNTVRTAESTVHAALRTICTLHEDPEMSPGTVVEVYRGLLRFAEMCRGL